EEAGVAMADVEVVAVARRPERNMTGPILHALAGRSSYPAALREALEDAARPIDWRGLVARATGASPAHLGFEVRTVEHLEALSAGALHDRACGSVHRIDRCECADRPVAILALDGSADFGSTLIAQGGAGGAVEPLARVLFPHSLGIFQAMVAQLAGVPGDEGALEVLASEGGPRFLDAMREVVRPASGADRGGFRLDLAYFTHGATGATLAPVGEVPAEEPLYSPAAVARFGPPPGPQDPIGARERDLAFAAQRVLEERLVALAAAARRRTGASVLLHAGTFAGNPGANAALRRSGFFDAVLPARGVPGMHAAAGAAVAVATSLGVLAPAR
ncbi:MAG TPA: carbamoyltransferase N-terminal domain-containing protein, partial [Planctomycetota bacterium]|nr:carbamoyltransferase N-terminal domain-containing protein [Planctomycetota bacterium]